MDGWIILLAIVVLGLAFPAIAIAAQWEMERDRRESERWRQKFRREHEEWMKRMRAKVKDL